MTVERPPVCDYEGSDYQTRFWEKGERLYEDRAEAIALSRLLPRAGRLLLEVGAGAGRNTSRYQGFERIVLLDYSRTQLQQAQARLGRSPRYIYVVADVYRLPFIPGLFDAATMIRVLHHMANPLLALNQVRQTLQTGSTFILEYANKQNGKAVLRYLLGRQKWSPFDRKPVEFAELNYDFHPQAVRDWLKDGGFSIHRQLTVSHFRIGLFKRLLPLELLVWMDSLAQLTGDWWQLTPSVFVQALAAGMTPEAPPGGFFRCPECASEPLDALPEALNCPSCGKTWPILDGIYQFRE